MFARLNQVARHLSRPLPNYLHESAASRLTSSLNPVMAAEANNKRTINTAACLIIGDEVLGGKVCRFVPPSIDSSRDRAQSAKETHGDLPTYAPVQVQGFV